jgi:hypothetical protein
MNFLTIAKYDLIMLLREKWRVNVTQVNKLIREPRHPIQVVPAVNNPF